MEKPITESAKFQSILRQDKIEQHHLTALKPEERKLFITQLYDKLDALNGIERDAFIEKTRAVLDQEILAEYNHAKIIACVDDYVRKTGNVPPVANIAQVTGFSRKTVYKHLKIARDTETWAHKKEAINMMTQNVLGVVLSAALKGDMKAARLYLEANKGLSSAETITNNQNNYIQINKTVINQQLIQQLSPEQLLQIEQIVSGNKKIPD